MVTGATKLVGVIGNPVAHSLSPVMHNAAFENLGMNWAYVPLPVEPHMLQGALRGLPALGFMGANVTVPHKEKVIQFLDELAPGAKKIGAVNTISVTRRGLVGDNTDWSGFLTDLRDVGFDPEGRRALILGSGGSGRAVAYGLGFVGAHVIICSRNVAAGRALATHLRSLLQNKSIAVFPQEDLRHLDSKIDLIVNTTPLGMVPDADSSPWPDEVPFPSCKLVYDLVYTPARTRLMEQAGRSGIGSVNGLGMLVRQAAESFKIWTRVDPPVAVMRHAAEESLLRGSTCSPTPCTE